MNTKVGQTLGSELLSGVHSEISKEASKKRNKKNKHSLLKYKREKRYDLSLKGKNILKYKFFS